MTLSNFPLARECFGATVGGSFPLGGPGAGYFDLTADRPPGRGHREKQGLTDHVWSDVTVAEGSLRNHVAAIRKALGDGQFGNRYIANIQRTGLLILFGTVVPLAGNIEIGNDKFQHQRQAPPCDRSR